MPKKAPKPVKVFRFLPCTLGQKEIKEYRETLPVSVISRKEMREAHITVETDEKDEIKGLIIQIEKLAKQGQGVELSTRLEEMIHREENLKILKIRHKGEALGVEAEIRSLHFAVASGVEFRRVECVLETNFDTHQATTTRKDTGEVVHQRTLNPEETQTPLPDGK